MRLARAVRDWWRVRTCRHYWRPAKTSRGAARWCEDCERIEQLTPDRFFAEFGESAVQRLNNLSLGGVKRMRVR